MTGLGIQTWVLSLIGIRAALSHREYLEILEVLRILGNSYRLASLGAGSSVIYGRFTFDFCRIIAACTARSIASRQSVQQAIGSIRIGNVTANVGPRGEPRRRGNSGDKRSIRSLGFIAGIPNMRHLRYFRRSEQRRTAGVLPARQISSARPNLSTESQPHSAVPWPS